MLGRFFLTLTSIQPLYGKLSDLFGRKPCLLFAYSVFGLGCLFCGLARNMTELILARAFSGIGGGGMTTVVSIMLSDIVPLRERGTWQGILNIVFAAGSGCGAPLGGLIADLIGWRWSFFFQVPLCAVAIIAVFFAIHLPPHDTSNWRKKFRRIDFLGAFLLVSAVFCLIFGMDRGANEKWKSIAALLPLCLSIPLFAIFVYVEAKVAKEPFAPAHLIFRRKVLPAYLCNFCSFGGYMGVIFFLPLYFQAVDQFSASQAGVHLLPGVIASVTGSLTGGLIMQRTGRYYWLNLLAYSVLFVAFIPMLLFSGTISNSLVGILIAFFFVGIGAGMGVTTSLIAIISNVQMKDQAVATANSYLFRSLGSVVGISLVSTVVQQSLKMQLKNRLKSGRDIDEIVAKVKHSLAYIETLQPAMQQVVRDCYGTAIRNGHVIGITLGFCAFVASSESDNDGRKLLWLTRDVVFVKEAKLSK